MASRFKVVFEGKLKSDIPTPEIRENLLKLYRGNQQIVNRFFGGKRLIIRKGLDQSAALKTQAILEKAGVHCQVVQELSEQQKEVAEPPKPSPAANTSVQTESRQRKSGKENSPQGAKEETAAYDFSFRGILAEAWGLTAGIKWKIIGSSLLAGMLSAALISLGYGIGRLLGEPGRNLFIAYGFQYGFGLLGYPLLAGLIMMGVKQAIGEQVDFSIVFHFFTGRILLLSFILVLVNYTMFAVLLSMGIDHFYARASSILTLPVFALTVPLVAVVELHPFAAIGKFCRMLRGHFLIMAGMYPALACINLFGNFVIIGFVWTVPLLFTANGVLFRNLINKEMRRGGMPDISSEKYGTASFQGIPSKAAQPALEGNAWQNILAAVFVGLICVSAGARLWALNAAYKILLPDHVASNSRGICVHTDKKLYFLSPEGRTERSVELGALGLDREPADLELLEDGSLLIGDMDKKTILRCSTENLSCRTVGPANNYRIADNFKFLADERRNLLFIADTNNHRIIVQDLEGTYYRTIEGSARIDYPNDMALDEQGMLWVSNTLHERLLCFKIDADSVTETGRYITVNPLAPGVSAVGEALLGAKDRKQTLADLRSAQKQLEELKKDLPSTAMDMLHTRPTSLAWGADGNVWVAASDPVGTTAGIRVFDAEGKQMRSIHLDPGAIPEDIVRAGDRLLIADPGLYQVFAAQSSSGNIFPFGDETFQRALADSRGRLEIYEAIGKWTKRLLWMSAIATAVLLFLILRTRRGPRQKKEVVDEVS